MNDFKNDLQQLSVNQFQTGEMTPWNQSQYAAGPYPGIQQSGPNQADPTRLCIGFCSGFCAGFCAGFCGGFCSGFCGGFCGGFCHHRCGGFCHHRCG
ncbi:hypothetical protein PAE9249_02525 [Paenibacillus sp. CECT 9249]|nr:hypothetical protein PAE9249_02525 [Paenibacillus sp. CECT 9249]